MRQELVRQYQEHQQATELLRQGHMQQMERQKENQDQLLAELESLKVQLAEVLQNSTSGLIWVNEGTSPGRFIFMIYIYLEGERGMRIFSMCMHAHSCIHTYLFVCVHTNPYMCIFMEDIFF